MSQRNHLLTCAFQRLHLDLIFQEIYVCSNLSFTESFEEKENELHRTKRIIAKHFNTK